MSHHHGSGSSARQKKAGVCRRIAGASAALAGCAVLGLGPVATAPSAHADLFNFDWLGDLFGSTVAESGSALDPSDTFWADLASWFDPSAHADLPGAAAAVSPDVTTALDSVGGTAPTLAGTGADTPTNVTVPIQMTATTEPIVQISVGGGSSIPVVLDTGSNGLVIPWYEIGLQGLTWPTNFGVSAYSGGLDYFYVTMPETIDFGQGAITTPVDVNAVLFSWPANLQNLFNPTYWSLPTFLGAARADGVLGIAPDAVGPDAAGTSLLSALPGSLGQGVLINETNPNGPEIVFGPSTLTGGHTVDGVANSNLRVSIDGGAQSSVKSIIDSGGVFGTMPSTVTGTGAVGSQITSGTPISVYDDHGQLLYTYTTANTPNGLNSPVVTSSSVMNTGYTPFSQMPVYIDLSNPSAPTTTFYAGQ